MLYKEEGLLTKKGTFEVKTLTTPYSFKGKPEDLSKEMREAFKRSEQFLDLELKEEDPLLKQKEEMHTMITKATPEEMQKILKILSVGNIKVRE